jgi:ADP-ribose pyrophosphatase YjhB (NUDIX family)
VSEATTANDQPSPRAYGILVHNDQLLLVRSRSDRYDPPMWWLPGGGIDPYEQPAEAVVREFGEETGITVGSPRLLFATADDRTRSNGEVMHTVRIIYEVTFVEGELRHEVNGTTEEARWFNFDDVPSLRLADYARQAWEAYRPK